MKEKEFTKQLTELKFIDGLVITPYYRVDKDSNVKLDIEGIQEEFNSKLNELLGILK